MTDTTRPARAQDLRDAAGVAPLDGAGLRETRKRLGLTQAELAALLDIKEGRTIRRWEAGEWPVPWTVAVTLHHMATDERLRCLLREAIEEAGYCAAVHDVVGQAHFEGKAAGLREALPAETAAEFETLLLPDRKG